MKKKIAYSLSILNLLLVISTINSFNFTLTLLPHNNFIDKLSFSFIFMIIPITLSLISIKLIKKDFNNKQANIYFIKYTSYITIIFFIFEFVVMIFH